MDSLPFIWSVAGILMMISETFIPGFVIFFFGLGALANGLLTAVFPGLRPCILPMDLTNISTVLKTIKSMMSE
ncbi:MAG TPA: hypothetical protein VMX75_13935 [Spirochaetia bacterium]|nr:hypothetical protein [Spirochaetia bacterium]